MSRLMLVMMWMVGGWLLTAALPGCAAQRPIESVRADGDFEFDRANYEAAAAHYQEIADRVPGDWRAQHRLGLSLIEVDRPADARRALEQAASLRPGDDDIADALAESMFREGSHDELFAYLRQRAEMNRDAEAYLNLAKYAQEVGDMDSASTALLTAIEVDDGESVEPYLRRAEFCAQVGDTDEVVRRLRQAYGISPQDTRVNAMLRQYGEVPGPTLALPPGR